MNRREFIAQAPVFSGLLAGCAGESETTSTEMTATTTNSPTETISPTSTPDSTKPQIVESEVSFIDHTTLQVVLSGTDSEGIQTALVQTSIDEVEKQGEGKTQIDLEGTVNTTLREEVVFTLKDLNNNVTERTKSVCFEAPLGKHLVKHGQPLELGWDEPEIVEHDGQYYLFYRVGGGGDKIAVAVSSNGIRWIDKGTVLDQGTGNAWDTNYVISPSYLRYNGDHYLFYEGNDGHISRIGWAKSENIDGPYEKSSDNPVLTPEQNGGFEEVLVGTPAVIPRADGSVRMYYHGWDAEHDRMAVARSTDLVNWEKAPSNPIIDVEPGTWYSSKIAPSDVIQFNGKDIVFIEGNDGTHWRSGVAIGADPFKQIQLAEYNPIIGLGSSGAFDGTHAHTPGGLITETEAGRELWVYYQGNDGAAYRLGRTTQPVC